MKRTEPFIVGNKPFIWSLHTSWAAVTLGINTGMKLKSFFFVSFSSSVVCAIQSWWRGDDTNHVFHIHRHSRAGHQHERLQTSESLGNHPPGGKKTQFHTRGTWGNLSWSVPDLPTKVFIIRFNHQVPRNSEDWKHELHTPKATVFFNSCEIWDTLLLWKVLF